jgi:hypothetical protein
MNPSPKNENIDKALSQLFGIDRKTTIHQNTCLPAPVGCGQPATEFRDTISEREYSISGLCQTCQDVFFGSGS